MEVPIFNLESLNLKISPFLQGNGQVLRALNVTRDSIGAYKKRSGYITFLGTPDNSQINSLWSWETAPGSINVYRASGSILYHSINGTGNWTTSGVGTITDGTQVFHGVTADTMLVGQQGGTTRHSTTGTSFTDTSGAPTQSLGFEEYQGKMWAIGTGQTAFFSATGTPTNWTATDDLEIPGPGRLLTIFKAGDRLAFGKNSGLMFQYDGYQLRDQATNLGPSSPYSIGEVEGYRTYLNRFGYFGWGGGMPEIISNPVERQIYNDLGSGIQGTTFDNAPGIAFKYDYYCSVGTLTDDLTNETTPDAIHKYDYQMDEFVNWQFANRPTSFGTYQDVNGNEQLIFGDSGGQAYQLSGTAISDNGNPIEVQLMGFYHGGNLNEKEWKNILFMFNPGCGAKVQIALSDTFTTRTLNWIGLGGAKDGVVEHKFPQGSRARFCFWKVHEYGQKTPFQFYGIQPNLEVLPTK